MKVVRSKNIRAFVAKHISGMTVKSRLLYLILESTYSSFLKKYLAFLKKNITFTT